MYGVRRGLEGIIFVCGAQSGLPASGGVTLPAHGPLAAAWECFNPTATAVRDQARVENGPLASARKQAKRKATKLEPTSGSYEIGDF